MKKAVFLFLCCVMLCSVSSCAQTYESPESIGGHDSDSDQTTSPVEDSQTDFSQPDKVYQYFSSCVSENPYDKWLKAELEKGERAEKTIYAEYLALWKEELAFTAESGEAAFDDQAQYEQWKSDIRQWLVISQEILKSEMNRMNCSLGELEVIVPYCEMVRQKTIDVKRFLYYHAVFSTLTPYTNIEIHWCCKHSQAMPDDYLQIIKSEKPFLLMGEEVLLEHYKSPYLQKYLNQCDTVQYTVLDMDGDGEEEVLIRGWTDDILVLHEEDGVVYGFDFTFREMYNVKTEGSYCWNANQGKSYGCSKLLFRKGTCSKIELSRVEHIDNGTDCYFVNDTEVDREAYDSFTESCVDVDYVTWYPLYLFPKNMEDKG